MGAGAVGSNSALVAPVKIGDGAIIGAGSVVTREVDANALAVARGKRTLSRPNHFAKATSKKRGVAVINCAIIKATAGRTKMCGIIGTIGKASVPSVVTRAEAPNIVADSAGVATLVDGKIKRRRAEGKIANPKR